MFVLGSTERDGMAAGWMIFGHEWPFGIMRLFWILRYHHTISKGSSAIVKQGLKLSFVEFA